MRRGIKSAQAILGLVAFSLVMPFVLLVCVRLFVQARMIPPQMETMAPTFRPGDRFLIESASIYLRRKYKRGEIIVFYPPPVETGGRDLSNDFLHVLGRASGLPYFPCEKAFVKRVIGLPGETVQVEPGKGVIVNGKTLDESAYEAEPVAYRLQKFGDIGTDLGDRRNIHPYSVSEDAGKNIVVPAGHLFVLGDNRNHSDDSHVFGMLDEHRVIGRAQVKIFPKVKILNTPRYD